ncbi:MAG: cation:proton antiporter [Xanthomonadales bacterium]|nr:cation:proton antiporter [Xanthomonadales bacterium]
MHEHTDIFLTSLAAVLCVAAITTLLFQRLRLPIVLGYLLAGAIIGPHLGLLNVADEATVTTLSELGVILLMFFLGLEFSLGKLARVGARGILIAVLEVGFLLWLGTAIGGAFGFSAVQSFFIGGIVAIGSTTIIAKVFEEQRIGGELRGLVFAVLIVEDLLAVLLLALYTTLGRGEEMTGWGLAQEGLRLVGFLAALIIIGLLVVPRLMSAVVKVNRPETTLVTSVGICFAAALAAQHFGYSVALGAFLAGSLVAESGEEHRVESLVRPVRDVFAAVFFVAVGMTIDPAILVRYWELVLALTLVVMLGKPLAVALGAFATGVGVRTSIRTGMTLSQIGEFSFIIAGLGVALGSLEPKVYSIAVSVAAVTAFTTPYMVRFANPVAAWVDAKLPRPLQTFAALWGSWIEQLGQRREPDAARRSGLRRLGVLLLLDCLLLWAVVIGAALGGEELSVWLEARTPLAAEAAYWGVLIGSALLLAPLLLGIFRLSRALARRLSRLALPRNDDGVDFGDAPRRALLLGLELGILLLVGISSLAITQPFLPAFRGAAVLAVLLLAVAIAFWRSATNLQGHVQAGSVAILEAITRRAPGAGAGAEAHALEQLQELLPGLGELFPVQVDGQSPVIGQTLAELNLRARTGATVLVIRRGEDSVLTPDGHERVAQGDTLVLAGSRRAVEAAADLLEGAE